MKTALEIAGPLVLCGWFFAAFIHTFCTSDTEEGEQ